MKKIKQNILLNKCSFPYADKYSEAITISFEIFHVGLS